ncbi:hypothetical protein GCM10009775_16200 [Microbacterium aoyamense]|uniref:HTH tetR-type domain-containing protein n=1 Tax=Microbacterium aoyamense TaxID=344166 RepID=A0ABN2PMU9_9MICO|nr:TetR/AcrR family transcriptional regulator [Microbacterium aoyamense]
MASRGSYAKGSARREEILATAVRVVSEKGYPGATLRGIGRELGIEPAHILYYFGSREELLQEVLEAWDAGSLDAVEEGADALAVYAAAIRNNATIRGMVHVYLSFAAEAVNPAHPAHDYFRRRFALSVQELSAAVRSGQESGVIRAEVDPERTARMLIALADGLQLQALMEPAVDASADLDAAIDGLFIVGSRIPIERSAQFPRP